MSEADLITIAVVVPLLAIAGLAMFVYWLIKRREIKVADKLENFYLSNRTQSILDQHPGADLMNRKDIHNKVIPGLSESQGIVT